MQASERGRLETRATLERTSNSLSSLGSDDPLLGLNFMYLAAASAEASTADIRHKEEKEAD